MQILVVAIYILIVYVIGFIGSRFTRNIAEYIIGNRKLSAYSTALGAGASDMSGWLMMALPGAMFLNGVREIWLPLGLTVGAYFNWKFVAKRLRNYTHQYGNALTIPWYLSNRFDKSRLLRVISAFAIVVFFTIYAAAALVACAFVLQELLQIDYFYALLLSTIVIVGYTSLGGFIAITWIDVFQGTLMLFALLILPIAIASHLGGFSNTIQILRTVGANISDPFYEISTLQIVSILSWGLGYFGQPHILSRFMAAKNADVISKSTVICMTWMILSLIGACLVGIFGSALFVRADIANHEVIFLKATEFLFSPWVAGIFLAAVLSAIMSTVSAQLLIAAASLVEDISAQYIHEEAFRKHRLSINKAAVCIISCVSLILAFDATQTVMSLVSYAWAGLGATLGPVILLSLYWPNMNKSGAMLGIILGGCTVVVWKNLHGGIFELYEIAPAFIMCCLGIVVGTFFERVK